MGGGRYHCRIRFDGRVVNRILFHPNGNSCFDHCVTVMATASHSNLNRAITYVVAFVTQIILMFAAICILYPNVMF